MGIIHIVSDKCRFSYRWLKLINPSCLALPVNVGYNGDAYCIQKWQVFKDFLPREHISCDDNGNHINIIGLWFENWAELFLMLTAAHFIRIWVFFSTFRNYHCPSSWSNYLWSDFACRDICKHPNSTIVNFCFYTAYVYRCAQTSTAERSSRRIPKVIVRMLCGLLCGFAISITMTSLFN